LNVDILQAVILGIIQGLAEFLPISSSGHLALAQAAMVIPGSFRLLMTVLLHAGTLAVVLAVFWRDWWEMLKNPFKSKIFWLLALATLPAAALGVLLGKKIDGMFADAWFVGIFFLCTAALLLAAEHFAKQPSKGRRARKPGVNDVRTGQALAMGAMQGVALFPGLSRSGSTIVGGMLAGLNRATATKFSFMMSAPIILGSLVFEAKDLFELEGGIVGAIPGGWLAPLIGVLVAAASGYFAIRWMLRLVQRVSLRWFALYTGALGALVLLDHFVFHLLL